MRLRLREQGPVMRLVRDDVVDENPQLDDDEPPVEELLQGENPIVPEQDVTEREEREDEQSDGEVASDFGELSRAATVSDDKEDANEEVNLSSLEALLFA